MAVHPSVAALTRDSALLGLRSGEVEVVEHNPGWAALFADMAPVIRDSLSDKDAQVEHVGSTSIPGLIAKPVLDVAVGLAAPINVTQAVRDLTSIGFEFQQDLGDYGGLFFTVCAAPEIAVCHLHLVDLENFQWKWYLAFRDGLRADPELRAKYEQLKRSAAGDHPASREAYNQAKSDWVLSTVTDLGGPPPATA